MRYSERRNTPEYRGGVRTNACHMSQRGRSFRARRLRPAAGVCRAERRPARRGAAPALAPDAAASPALRQPLPPADWVIPLSFSRRAALLASIAAVPELTCENDFRLR